MSKEFGVRTLEDEERRTSRYLLGLTALALVVGLLWAAFFELEEITRAQGRVIPASREQVVQSLDSGILREMLVKEGDSVEEGQVAAHGRFAGRPGVS
ncbi:MAG: hypothetical protein ACKOFG_08395 [Limnohabitans sp.]